MRVGRLRESEFSETAVAVGATWSVLDVLSVYSSAGSAQLSEGPWTWRAAFGVGIELASLGTNFRYTFRPEGRGTSRAVAVSYTRRDPAHPNPGDASLGKSAPATPR